MKNTWFGDERSFGISVLGQTVGKAGEAQGVRDSVRRSCDCLWHHLLLYIFNSDSRSRTHTHTLLLFIFFAAVRSVILSLIASWLTCDIVLISKDTTKFPLISVHLSINICIHLTHCCIRFGQEFWPKGGRDLILPETILL